MTTSPCKPLTDSSLPHLFHRKCEYHENLCHYLSEHRRHFHREWNARIDVETRKERLNALEKIDEDYTACGDVFSRLKGTASGEQILKYPEDIYREEDANSRKYYFRRRERLWVECFRGKLIRREHSVRLTRPAPSTIVAENMWRR